MTFITVNYGDDKREIFNPNCQTKLLIENIKTRCKYPLEMQIELCDFNGNLKNISQTSDKYANNILTVDRENLVLLQVKRHNEPRDVMHDSLTSLASTVTDGVTNDVTYIPLLRNSEVINSRFTARLTNRDSPTPRSESRSRRSKEKKEKNRKSVDVTVPPSDVISGSPVVPKKRNGSSSKRTKSRGKQK